MSDTGSTDWDKVHALLEPWQEVWKGDRAKYAANYPNWILAASAELFAHDMCDAWAWNDYVSAAAVIIARHFNEAAAHSSGITQAPADLAAARLYLLKLIVRERNDKVKRDHGNHRFLHSFYAAGSDQQILADDRRGYGRAILEDFENTVTLEEVAGWMTEFAAEHSQREHSVGCPTPDSIEGDNHADSLRRQGNQAGEKNVSLGKGDGPRATLPQMPQKVGAEENHGVGHGDNAHPVQVEGLQVRESSRIGEREQAPAQNCRKCGGAKGYVGHIVNSGQFTHYFVGASDSLSQAAPTRGDRGEHEHNE